MDSDAPSAAPKSARAIEVEKASTHNLKAIDCRVPHGKVTVVTGPSGAGKSSLAFDTIYAEAQRRFIESMSTYARQFLEQVERPPVEAMRGILPAVALEARNTVKNARSTVGTMTEAYDVLRLVFAHLGGSSARTVTASCGLRRRSRPPTSCSSVPPDPPPPSSPPSRARRRAPTRRSAS